MHFRRFAATAALLLLVAASAGGCARGDYRRIALHEDLTEGDLAHYRSLARSKHSELEDYSAGLPLLLAPVVHRSREGRADRAAADRVLYHFEDTFSTLFILANRIQVANFDHQGRSLSYDSTHQLLLGLVSVRSGHRRASGDDDPASTGGFSLLWSGFGYERTTHSRTLRLFWIPFTSRDG